jgi:hypothetical protein
MKSSRMRAKTDHAKTATKLLVAMAGKASPAKAAEGGRDEPRTKSFKDARAAIDGSKGQSVHAASAGLPGLDARGVYRGSPEVDFDGPPPEQVVVRSRSVANAESGVSSKT